MSLSVDHQRLLVSPKGTTRNVLPNDGCNQQHLWNSLSEVIQSKLSQTYNSKYQLTGNTGNRGMHSLKSHITILIPHHEMGENHTGCHLNDW